jgi:phosphatidate cytidylyltransferase
LSNANRNLLVRIGSAVALLPVVLVLLWAGPTATAWLVAAAAALIAWELYTMAFKRPDAGQIIGAACAAALPLCLAYWPERFAAITSAGSAGLIMALLIVYLFIGPLPEAPVRVSLVFAGVFYSGLASAIVGLRQLPQGLAWVSLALLVTWLNDTGAYAAGRGLGRHKLYPKISPAKTWEGFFGGLVVSVAGAFAARATFFPGLSPADCLLVALPASVLGPLGDLSESMLKRAFGAKDSGKVMPGHGGLLDRVDALLFNAPYIYLYAILSRG